MSQAPAKNKQKKKEKGENIFLDIISNILVQLPLAIIFWIISQFNLD
jgi:hypothetical protein